MKEIFIATWFLLGTVDVFAQGKSPRVLADLGSPGSENRAVVLSRLDNSEVWVSYPYAGMNVEPGRSYRPGIRVVTTPAVAREIAEALAAELIVTESLQSPGRLEEKEMTTISATSQESGALDYDISSKAFRRYLVYFRVKTKSGKSLSEVLGKVAPEAKVELFGLSRK